MADIGAWLKNNLLTLNPTKTKFICFHKTKASAPDETVQSIRLHTCSSPTDFHQCSCTDNIERAQSLRYLGVILDQNLNFNAHISGVVGRCRKLIYIMKQIRDLSDTTIHKLVYTALCESIIGYCVSCWGGAAKTHLLKLERAQRCVLKVLLKKHFQYSTFDLFRDFEVLTVRQLFIAKSATAAYKHLLSLPTLSEILNKRVIRLAVPACRTTFAQRFSTFLQPFLLNKLIKVCPFIGCTIKEAQVNLKKYLFTLDYETTESLLETSS
ncbi:hypothetical protein JYU34_021893 [Plutella xylostella]|uniref:Uncharacterized protein n=1 Tax=Plutella xylostella TaxID=51655 RepID=A0ABQ7PT74_PLUXY|nr:hypothetical protein JYU34_021893 [Plutella xylostella]